MAVADAVAIAVDGDGAARARLSGVLTAQLQVLADQPAACRALIADLGLASRIPDIAQAIIDAFYGSIERLLREGADDGSSARSASAASPTWSSLGRCTSSRSWAS